VEATAVSVARRSLGVENNQFSGPLVRTQISPPVWQVAGGKARGDHPMQRWNKPLEQVCSRRWQSMSGHPTRLSPQINSRSGNCTWSARSEHNYVIHSRVDPSSRLRAAAPRHVSSPRRWMARSDRVRRDRLRARALTPSANPHSSRASSAELWQQVQRTALRALVFSSHHLDCRAVVSAGLGRTDCSPLTAGRQRCTA
jgi:hypothetical protein